MKQNKKINLFAHTSRDLNNEISDGFHIESHKKRQNYQLNISSDDDENLPLAILSAHEAVSLHEPGSSILT